MNTNPFEQELTDEASLIAHVLDDVGVPFEIDHDGAVRAVCEGLWHSFDIWFVINPEVEALHVCACLRSSISGDETVRMRDIVARVNERLWLGHCELWSSPSEVVWRYTLPNPGNGEYASEQIVAILQGARDAADRFAPICEFVFCRGQSPEDAIDSPLFETMGQA
jgi:hypothetical protein